MMGIAYCQHSPDVDVGGTETETETEHSNSRIAQAQSIMYNAVAVIEVVIEVVYHFTLHCIDIIESI